MLLHVAEYTRMTTLLKQALRRVERLPSDVQDRAARLLLDLSADAEVPTSVGPLEALLNEPRPPARSAAQIDADLSALRDEWDS